MNKLTFLSLKGFVGFYYFPYLLYPMGTRNMFLGHQEQPGHWKKCWLSKPNSLPSLAIWEEFELEMEKVGNIYFQKEKHLD